MTRTQNTTTTAGNQPVAILTVDDVARRLQITKGQVYELTRFRQASETPRLPARKVGRSLRFIASEIDGWLLSLPKHRHLQKRRYIKKDVVDGAAMARRAA